MTIPCYKSGKLMMTAACYEIGNNDDKSNNNKDKICLLWRRWDLVGQILDYVLYHMIIGFMTTELQTIIVMMAE